MEQLELLPRTTRLEALKKALDKYGHAVDPLLRSTVEYLIECSAGHSGSKSKEHKPVEESPLSIMPRHFIPCKDFKAKHDFANSTINLFLKNLSDKDKAKIMFHRTKKHVWVDEIELLKRLRNHSSTRVSKTASRCLRLLRKEAKHDKA